ncbi:MULTISPECIES: hypothetical protein [unclassified Actinomyces]|uniref:hypothetical protein n=1 Tax=unclassified Actinomyces TaxID=2609248 RepID=UPI0020180C44|nr:MULTISPECIES: hypothetical protein [unclassified Actinomyces]MCL3778118.1 hypothetical protein [Actinomyces sp. AC-20-1]MCL3789395.1 hypothetical protein [Actinomyces sp. 187325]MCL3791748.1 hypothetical protein [Actinomyces sp. 186855]MCL3794400.1 hypothetical protein [Actinomyces sp. 217892]
MGVVDAPQWLLPAYVRSVRALGSTATTEQVHQAGERLIEMWASPDRRFHNLKHAIDMLARVDELADESHNPDVMRLAAWYHGCVFSSASEQTYCRNGGEDEEASAAYAREDLTALGVPERVTERVCALIINLKRHNLEQGDIDALALNDADLGTLAVDPQEYKRYRELVRQEYAHIPDGDYLRARLAIVSRLLARESLFCSPLGQRWEAAARENLEAERKRLEDGLAALPNEVVVPAGGLDEHEAVQSGAAGEPAVSATDTPAAPAGAGGPTGSTGATGSTAPGAPAEPSQSPQSAHSAPTPSGGLPRVSTPPTARTSTPPVRRAETAARALGPQEVSRVMEHATSMESCIEDLDAILSSKPLGQEAPADRQAQAESERLKMAERLRLKAEEAKCLREARTGEITPVVAEIVDDGAAGL